MQNVQEKIAKAFTHPELIKEEETKQAVLKTIEDLNRGLLRVCEKRGEDWHVNEWIKQAILMYFRLQPSQKIQAGELSFFDKVPLKKWEGSEGVRVVPHALVRYGAFVEAGAILMPSYVNIGAYVGSGSMVDTWATVGSCAQIGSRVHLSGGVGIGGVLEPVQARPVIIEDDCFVGSRCIVVEGVHVKRGAVLAAGLCLTASTPVLDVTASEVKTYKGEVPEYSVVIPGTREKDYPGGKYSIPCALIIGKRNARTDEKTSLTDALRDFELAV